MISPLTKLASRARHSMTDLYKKFYCRWNIKINIKINEAILSYKKEFFYIKF